MGIYRSYWFNKTTPFRKFKSVFSGLNCVYSVVLISNFHTKGHSYEPNQRVGVVLYLPPDDAGRDGEGKTPHSTASQTPEHLRTESE